MKEMNEKELDALISASFEREELLEQINRSVMTDVRRQAHRAWLRRWGRMAAFAFGVPTVLTCFAYSVYNICTTLPMHPAIVVGLALSATAIIGVSGQTVKEFSIDNV